MYGIGRFFFCLSIAVSPALWLMSKMYTCVRKSQREYNFTYFFCKCLVVVTARLFSSKCLLSGRYPVWLEAWSCRYDILFYFILALCGADKEGCTFQLSFCLMVITRYRTGRWHLKLKSSRDV